ncbi:FMN-binding negative transcriptional regulator [Erythrobacter sp. R86502]|uniref:FMN-binding negative transcriptional regulator n=1 Tax=Erythrobacter sp. R86502 TaxID=3093846 RepID=UPI0036D3ECD6
MHPNPLFRSDDLAAEARLVEQIGFGMVIAATPDGPRVAHTPLLMGETGTVQFHLARSNAITRHLEGAKAQIVVNGPDAYVSPRWYDDRNTVPTWNYVALELEGPVRRMADAELEGFLRAAIAKHEARLGGEPWRAEESSDAMWASLFRGIVGFELTITERRPTYKMSQNKMPETRARIADGLAAAGASAMADYVRGVTA